jgi:hypothetical protein
LSFFNSKSWYQSKWRPCSKTCGKGVQIREVVCRGKTAPGKFETVPDDKCDMNKKPKGLNEQDCNMIDCPAEWVPTEWSKVWLLVFLVLGRGEGWDGRNSKPRVIYSVTNF